MKAEGYYYIRESKKLKMSGLSAQHGSGTQPKTLQDLQSIKREIQSFGPGPYTPEQQQKINQHNLLFQKVKEESAKFLKRPPGSSSPLVIMSSPSSTPMQVQSSSTGQQLVVSTSTGLRGMSSVLPQGAVLMQQAIPTTSLPTQMNTNNPSSQSPSKVTIISNNQKGSSSLSQLSLLAQHPQGHGTPAISQIHIKPSTAATATFTSSTKPGTTIQRQVLPVQTLPVGHAPVRMVASIPGHQTATGHVLTTVNIPGPPQKHTITQRPIAPHGISVQQTPQGTPMVIQVSAAPSSQAKPTLVAATAVRSATPATLIPQTSSNESLKVPLSAAPKVSQQISQGLHSAESVSAEPQKVLSRKRIQELLQEIDPRATLDEDVEDLLLQIADDFIESVVNSSCQIAKHRKSNVLDVRDIQLHLERNWNMWIPGYGTEDFKQSRKLGSTEAHKQRLALIRKSMKK